MRFEGEREASRNFVMAPSFDFDCSTSNLLCAEDNSSIMLFAGEVGEEFGGGDAWVAQNHRTLNQNQSFHGGEFSIELPLITEECFNLMVEKECQHLPRDDYMKRLQSGDLDMGVRGEAVDWMRKVHAYYSFGPLSAYLSINYLDRFLSAYELPRGKIWMMQLLAVTCLSLAAKMDETEVPMSLDLQLGDSKFIFEAITIQRMELLVLSTLKWRMQAVTPFSFIDYFLRKIKDDNQPPPDSSISRAVELILITIKGIGFLDFRPSELAAAVAISVSSSENETVDIDKAVSCFIHVEKERVLKCLELIKDESDKKVVAATGLAPSVPQSPIGVLDAACLSYKTDGTVGSCANSSHNSPDAKRRKLNRPI
ncbi:cyclin-D3-1-like [Macadamia integrifolia]|uniref:cyclin-D3-1-like n=1 Tax=Macadamia integrifolia TaxID=60698 RepID=UPI001C4F18A5|nr:cyclin-D3-1-like [Macadamia integrifolia]